MIGSNYQRVLDLLKEIEDDDGLICGTAKELSSLHFLLDLLLVTSFIFLNSICPPKFIFWGKTWFWFFWGVRAGGAWGTQMPIFSGENEFILLSISESQIGNTSLSPIYNIKSRLDNHLNKKKKTVWCTKLKLLYNSLTLYYYKRLFQ